MRPIATFLGAKDELVDISDEFIKSSADVNSDSEINSADLLKTVKYLKGKLQPVGKLTIKL